jgi:hypothetical protein
MSAVLVAAAVLVALGGVVATAARDPRLACAGLLLVLGVSPFLVASPEPLPLAARLVGSALAVYLVWIALRDAPAGRGSLVGWPADVLAAVAAFIAGWLIASTLASFPVERAASADGPTVVAHAATGAAAALAILALAPILIARDVARLGMALLLSIVAIDAGRRAVGVAAGPLDEVAIGVGLAAVAAAVAWTCIRTLTAGGSLAVPDDPRRARS